MVIKTNFVIPFSRQMYKDAIKAFRNDPTQAESRRYGTALGNKWFIFRRWHGLILVSQHKNNDPQPIGYP